MPNKIYMKDKAIIVDIDGTLTYDPLYIKVETLNIREEKNNFLEQYGYYNMNHPRIQRVEPREDIIRIIKSEVKNGVIPFFVTAREEAIEGNQDSRRNTLEFLRVLFKNEIEIRDEQLLMRTFNDFSPNYEVKEEIYNKFIKGRFEVLYCLEDEEKNIEMFKRNGLLVLQVH